MILRFLGSCPPTPDHRGFDSRPFFSARSLFFGRDSERPHHHDARRSWRSRSASLVDEATVRSRNINCLGQGKGFEIAIHGWRPTDRDACFVSLLCILHRGFVPKGSSLRRGADFSVVPMAAAVMFRDDLSFIRRQKKKKKKKELVAERWRSIAAAGNNVSRKARDQPPVAPTRWFSVSTRLSRPQSSAYARPLATCCRWQCQGRAEFRDRVSRFRRGLIPCLVPFIVRNFLSMVRYRIDPEARFFFFFRTNSATRRRGTANQFSPDVQKAIRKINSVPRKSTRSLMTSHARIQAGHQT